TNGKGSTAATLASILAAAGYRTGLYTSPHLERVTERIRVSDGITSDPVIPSEARGAESRDPRICLSPFTEIPEPDFARLYFQVDETGRRLVADGRLPHPPSYFETLTALAFLYFAERNLDIAILEVGLGGRLDATNIVDPLLSIITDIALDHQEYLGPTIAAIAREKAGILRPGGTLITLPQHPEANHAIGEAAMELGVRGINAADYLPGRDFQQTPGGPFIERSEMGGGVASPQLRAPSIPQSHRGMGGIGPQSFKPAPGNDQPSTINHQLPPNHYDLFLSGQVLHIRSPLAGEHQQRNIALAIAAAIELRNQSGDNIRSDGVIRNHVSYNIPDSAIEAGISHTSEPGRLEFLSPTLLLDVAHNPAGAWTLRAAIASLPESQPRTLLFCCLRDK